MADRIAIDETEVHFWAFEIDPSDIAATRFHSLLSMDETGRANQFRSNKLRNNFAVCHGLLRLLLGRYLGASPQSISFDYQSKGKPVLRDGCGLDFNLSHTDGMMVCGVTRRCAIGVDVELRRPLNDMQEIAESFFCPEETRELLSLPEDQRMSSFYRCWTRKEACIKATGEGLSTSLQSFRVTLSPFEAAKILHIEGDENLAQSWNLLEVELAAPYTAALAYPGLRRKVEVHRTMDAMAFLNKHDSLRNFDGILLGI